MKVRRGVTRPAATARQPGAEMNEMYGISTSAGISQDNSVLNYNPDLLSYPWLCKSGYLIPTYPGICKYRHLIPTYLGLSLYLDIQGYLDLPSFSRRSEGQPGSRICASSSNSVTSKSCGWSWCSGWQLEEDSEA